MHLIIDAVGTKHSGAATVLIDFLKVAVADERIAQITVLCSPQAQRDFSLTWSEKLLPADKPLVDRSRLARLWWYVRGLGQQSRKIGADIVLCMSGQGQSVLPTPHVTFVQQSLPFSPEALSRVSRKRRFEMGLIRLLMRWSCRKAQTVIVQTPTMANWVSHAFGLDNNKVEIVVPIANITSSGDINTTEFEPMNSADSGSRILYVGSSSGYKMLNTIVEGMRQLRNVCPLASLFLTVDPSLRFTGIPGVVCLGHVERKKLSQTYVSATAVVLPSLVETVGLPMIEAMSLGVPVIAADRPYAHDICEDAALYFDPLSSSDFAEKAMLLLQSPQLQQQLSVKGQQLMCHRAAASPYQRMVDIIVAAAECGTLKA